MRKFIVYDFEWVPGTLEIRVAGVFDGEAYRFYKTVGDFLDGELTSKNRGRWFYAHAGGLADIQFVLDEAIKRGLRVDAAFSGSSAIIVKIKRGRNCWTFVDSYWLLRAPLEKIGKWVGLDKGASEQRQTEEEAREYYASAPLQELILYNQLDCEILYQAIFEYQQRILEMGGQLQMTQASCAMHLFRRRYLTSELTTSGLVNDLAREAYFASRVEVFQRFAGTSKYYDINSSFPYAMTKCAPGRALGMGRKLPDYGLYMADVEVTSPDAYLPPIPTRLQGRLFFPIGRWRSWLMSADIELLQREGGRIERVHQVVTFAPFYELRDYAIDLYERRRKETDGFSKVAYKLLLNSLYGKFAESPFKSSLSVDPAEIRPTMEMLSPGVWLEERKVPVPHMHVPISAHITALARRRIFDYMAEANESYYCDTDGFATDSEFRTTDKLGGLKLEKILTGGEFVAPKLYRLQGTDENGEPLPDDVAVAAKGFSRMTPEKWERLVSGDEIEHTRMRRVKETFRRGEQEPKEILVTKRIKNVLPKRHTYPDGHTRPWTLDELRDILGGSS